MAEQNDPRNGPNGEVAPVRHDMLLAEQVTKHARTSWLGLLGFLAFAGVTLLGVEDKDFFAYGVKTDLPLIGVSIPTSSFFWTAPILATVLYLNLHLYLLKLWKIVSSLPDRIDGEPLGARLWPWLVTDWALARRGDQGGPLPLRTIQWLLTVGLVWLAGPLVLFGFWWRSMVKHDLLLTSFLGLLLVLALYVGGAGWVFAKERRPGVKETDADGRRRARSVVGRIRRAGAALWRLIRLGWLPARVTRAAVFVLMAVPVLWISVQRTWLGTPPTERRIPIPSVDDMVRVVEVTLWEHVVLEGRIPLVRARLSNTQLSVKPADWLDGNIARLEFLRGLPAGTELEGEEKEKFETEWQRRRFEYLSHIKAPVLKDADLRGARLNRAFLARANLARANLEGASLFGAHLEGANLRGAYLEGAHLGFAHLEGADLRLAHLEGVRLRFAHLQGAILMHARLEGADLTEAHLEGAHLSDAHLAGANLRGAYLQGADLFGAHLREANLNDAHMEGARLTEAHLEGADLAGAQLVGAVLWGADLSSAKNLTQEQLDGAIGDEDTKLPDGLTVPSCWTDYPKLPEGMRRPQWWDDAWFRRRALCGEGTEPRRFPARD